MEANLTRVHAAALAQVAAKNNLNIHKNIITT